MLRLIGEKFDDRYVRHKEKNLVTIIKDLKDFISREK